jgi:acetoacetate decarboxylase
MEQVSFNKSFEEIQKSVTLKAHFYNAEMLAVLWLTKSEIVKKLLPPPLNPMNDPLVFCFVANYPKTNFGLPYKESAIFLGAEYEGELGFHCLSMPVTDDMAMAGGRELGGYPKKIAQIELEKNNSLRIGWTKRHGIRFMELQGNFPGEYNASKIQEFVDLVEKPGGMIVFNYLHGRRPLDDTIQSTFHLSKELITTNQQSIEIGEAKVILNESKHDPWAEIEVVEVLGAIYTVSNNIMQGGTILTEVEPMSFAPYAFRMWDSHL